MGAGGLNENDLVDICLNMRFSFVLTLWEKFKSCDPIEGRV